MGSNSGRKSDSSGRSPKRKRVVISSQQPARSGKVNPRRNVKTATTDVRRKAERSEVSDAARRRSHNLREQRERRIRQQKLKVKLKVIGIGLVALSVVAGIVGIYRSALFTIERVEIVGNAQLTVDEVRALAALPRGATLLRYPGAAMTERLEASPWISSASVSRDFPDGLRIRVTERVPVARIDAGEAFWLVDGEGWAITPQSAEETSALVVVRDVPDFEPVEGERSSSAILVNALAVWEGLSDALKARTRLISAPSVDKTALVTTDDIEIFIGSADEIAKKDVVVRSILDEQAGRVVYINVRSVDRPTWRGIASP